LLSSQLGDSPDGHAHFQRGSNWHKPISGTDLYRSAIGIDLQKLAAVGTY